MRNEGEVLWRGRVLGGARPACMEAEAGCEFAGCLCVPGNGSYSVSQKAV